MNLSRALVAATALLAVLPAVPTHAAPAADPPPRAVSLVGRDLHLPGGRTVTLPGAAGSDPVLLGTSRSGWVVASGGAFRLVRPDGRVRRVAGRDRTNPEVSEGLSDDGRWIISSALDQADALTLRVVDLRGEVVIDSWYQNGPGDYLDADDGKVYVGGQDGLRVVTERTPRLTRLLSVPTSLVDASRDVVFVGTDRNPFRVGPTRLSDPGAPAWRANFTPVAVSVDGRYVVGREGGVRAMADGTVVRRVPAPRPGDEQRFLGWGVRHEVLLEKVVGRRHLLVSCPVPSGRCHQVGSTTALVSLPTSHSGPYFHY